MPSEEEEEEGRLGKGVSSNPTTSTLTLPDERGTATVAREGGLAPKYVLYFSLAGRKRDMEERRRVMWVECRGRDKFSDPSLASGKEGVGCVIEAVNEKNEERRTYRKWR